MKNIMVVSPRSFETHRALRVGTVLAACVLLAGVSTAKANTIVLTENAYSYHGVYLTGGEFNAVTSDPFLSSYSYAPTATIINNGFETFCVETTVYFTPGTTYSYKTDNKDSNNILLTKGAAYLYYEFGKGLLSGYNYSLTGTGRNTDAGALQAAIWWFQNHQVGGSGFYTSSTIISDPFYTDAINRFGGSGSTDAFNPNNGTYGVEILQLTDVSGNCVQNQLVLTPVPETSSTLMLLGAALTTLGFAGRKLRSK